MSVTHEAMTDMLGQEVHDGCREKRRYPRPMPDLNLTIVYESDPDSDWIVASIPEVPGAHSQGRTREEAREMVLDALVGLNDLPAREREPLGECIATESLDIVFA